MIEATKIMKFMNGLQKEFFSNASLGDYDVYVFIYTFRVIFSCIFFLINLYIIYKNYLDVNYAGSLFLFYLINKNKLSKAFSFFYQKWLNKRFKGFSIAFLYYLILFFLFSVILIIIIQ